MTSQLAAAAPAGSDAAHLTRASTQEAIKCASAPCQCEDETSGCLLLLSLPCKSSAAASHADHTRTDWTRLVGSSVLGSKHSRPIVVAGMSSARTLHTGDTVRLWPRQWKGAAGSVRAASTYTDARHSRAPPPRLDHAKITKNGNVRL
jgi:hypothetical protein